MINLIGNKYGKLTVLCKHSSRKTKHGSCLIWSCLCDCGSFHNVAGQELRAGKTKSCGKCIINNGGFTKRRGYVFKKSPEHGFADKRGYVAYHRLVMEQHIGRTLEETETVHHVNGIKTDNGIDNLELWGKSHPPGQRVKDKIAWAIEFLRIHRPELLR